MPLLNVRVKGQTGDQQGKSAIGSMDLDNNYPGAPGYPVDGVGGFQMNVSAMIVIRPVGTVNDMAYDSINRTVRVFVDSSGADLAPGTDLSGITGVVFIAYGS